MVIFVKTSNQQYKIPPLLYLTAVHCNASTVYTYIFKPVKLPHELQMLLLENFSSLNQYYYPIKSDKMS